MRRARNMAPQILTGAACVGAVATAASAIIDTHKAIDILDDYAESENLTRKEIPPKVAIAKTWPCYIPTALLCGTTIGCAIASNRISAIQLAEMTAALSYAYKHRDKLVGIIDNEFEGGFASELKTNAASTLWLPTQTVEDTGYGDLLCMETYSGRWFLSSEEEVRAGLDRFNKELRAVKYLYMNDFYKALHLSTTHFGTQYGWPWSFDEEWFGEEVTFSIDILPDFLTGEDDHTMAGRPLLIVDFENEVSYPIELWHYC